jgi:hypothetical protein
MFSKDNTNMAYETLADLLEAYQTNKLSKDAPLCIDEENNMVFVEDEVDSDEDNHLFRLSFREFITEAANILGLPIDD